MPSEIITTDDLREFKPRQKLMIVSVSKVMSDVILQVNSHHDKQNEAS